MTITRDRLTNKERAELHDRCRGDKEFPDCNICTLPIRPGQKWHVSHNPYLPRAIGGKIDGIAHDKCNLDHARRHDVPLIAKLTRLKQKHQGAFQTSGQKLPGSKSDPFKMKISSGFAKPVSRRTGEPW